MLLWSRLTEIGEHILENQVIAKILSTLPKPITTFIPPGTIHQKQEERSNFYLQDYKKKRRLHKHSTGTIRQQKEPTSHQTISKILLNQININCHNNPTADLIHIQCQEEVIQQEEGDIKQEEEAIQESEDIVEVSVEISVRLEAVHKFQENFAPTVD